MAHSQLEHGHDLLPLEHFRTRLYHRFVQPVLRASEKENTLIRNGRDGGYYALYSLSLRAPQVILRVGILESQEIARTAIESCQENFLRLAAHPSHQTSRESADAELGKFAGAVRGEDYLHSFAGLTEDLNEVVALLIAISLGDLSFDAGKKLLGDNARRYLPIVEKALQGIAA